MLVFTMLAFTMASINGADKPADCNCYVANGGANRNDVCTTAGCSTASGGTVDCAVNSYGLLLGNGYNGLNIAGCTCPGDSYSGSVSFGLCVNGYNGVYSNGTSDLGYNYNSCPDFGSLAAGLGAPADLANNALFVAIIVALLLMVVSKISNMLIKQREYMIL